jgi:hypothetical protein
MNRIIDDLKKMFMIFDHSERSKESSYFKDPSALPQDDCVKFK